ncbi:MAG: M20/M25/M40 family metallo-hydrolase, partial [Anaerolineales bacterium]|nr:M20/M25/M40 family metallo-hydrolase [Anaerolineales bacterium]
MTDRISELMQIPSVQAALSALQARGASAIAEAIAIQQIAAPTFAEAARAAYVQEQFAAAGLRDVDQDDLHNVYGRLPGRGGEQAVVVSAHLDTVFAPDTDLTVRRRGRFVYGPGIADNSMGVAGLLMLAQTLRAFDPLPRRDIWFVANVGEEGLGDLRGMRAVADRFGGQARYIVVEGGLYGQVFHQAIGVNRFRIEVEAPGGHSWGAFGTPSAIHVLGRLIAAIDEIPVPQRPKTTYNVGVIEGGLSVNSIAQSASLLLDLRSEDANALANLVETVRGLTSSVIRQPGVTVGMTQVGNRPAGGIAADAPLVQWAMGALRAVGCRHSTYESGSTDANIPLSRGWPAVCIGLAR